jgi:hypothetical protein
MTDPRVLRTAAEGETSVSRRTLLQRTASLAALTAGTTVSLDPAAPSRGDASASTSHPRPRDSFGSLFAVMERYPLVGIATVEPCPKRAVMLG